MFEPTFRPAHLWLCALFALLLLASSGSQPSLASSSTVPTSEADPVVARVGGLDVLQSEAEAQARAELAALDRKRHEILEAATQAAVTDRLLELEAEARGLPLDSILAEIEAETAEVSDQEVSAWYQRNQARIRAPLERVAGQVRSFLEAERRQQVLADRVAELSDKFDVEILLEPLRFDLRIDDAFAFGPADAPVTLVEYGDFECPPCGRLFGELKKLKAEYGDRMRFVFEHYPLESIHPRARAASRAAWCAGQQDEFWAMHDALFAEQRALLDADFLRHAGTLGLDAEAFEGCLASAEADAAVDQDLADGRSVGVSSTPTLFLNGKPLDLRGGDLYPQLEAAIEKELGQELDGEELETASR